MYNIVLISRHTATVVLPFADISFVCHALISNLNPYWVLSGALLHWGVMDSLTGHTHALLCWYRWLAWGFELLLCSGTFLQMTAQEVRLCGLLLQEHFGDVVEKVGTHLLKNGAQNLRTIIHETGVSLDLVLLLLLLLPFCMRVIDSILTSGYIIYTLHI